MSTTAVMAAAAAWGECRARRGAKPDPPAASRTPLLLLSAHSNFRANFVAISNGGDNNSQQFHFLKADWRGVMGRRARREAAAPKIVATSSSSSDF